MFPTKPNAINNNRDIPRDGGRLKRARGATCSEYKLLSSETDVAGVQLLFITGWVIAMLVRSLSVPLVQLRFANRR